MEIELRSKSYKHFSYHYIFSITCYLHYPSSIVAIDFIPVTFGVQQIVRVRGRPWRLCCVYKASRYGTGCLSIKRGHVALSGLEKAGYGRRAERVGLYIWANIHRNRQEICRPESRNFISDHWSEEVCELLSCVNNYNYSFDYTVTVITRGMRRVKLLSYYT